jgi:RNase P subunit RPR2
VFDVFKIWVKTATFDQLEQLARDADVSVPFLYQLAKGQRSASAATAGRIEQAAKSIRKKSGLAVPELTRADLCRACAVCPYFKKG